MNYESKMIRRGGARVGHKIHLSIFLLLSIGTKSKDFLIWVCGAATVALLFAEASWMKVNRSAFAPNESMPFKKDTNDDYIIKATSSSGTGA